MAQDDIGEVVRKLEQVNRSAHDEHSASHKALEAAIDRLPEQVQEIVSGTVYRSVVKPFYLSNLRGAVAQNVRKGYYVVSALGVIAAAAMVAFNIVSVADASFNELNRYNALYAFGGVLMLATALNGVNAVLTCTRSRALNKEIKAVEQSQSTPQQVRFPELYPVSF